MKKPTSLLFAIAVISIAQTSGAQVPQSIIPAERATEWNPGIPGGIPVRNTVCASISASDYGNGSSDARRAIQNAINACPEGQVVQLSAGTFRISSGPIEITKGVTLRGAGPTRTILQAPDGTNQPVVVIGRRWIKVEASTNLVTDAVKGARSVQVASTAGLRAGQLVLIDAEANDALSHWGPGCDTGCKSWFSRTNRPLSQMMEITSISGNTVTFSTPFHITFDTAHAAQLSRFESNYPAVRSAGLEDLKVYGGEGGDGGGNIYMEFAMYSWVKNVESEYSSGASIHLYRTFRSVVRDSYFHHTKNPNPGGAGYGIDISTASADNLIENNISWAFNKVILMRASGGGNVIGYNYMEDGYGAGYRTIPEVGLNASHMTTPHHELFEGNQAWNLGSDSRWGNSIYITFFRNHATGLRRSLGGLGLQDTNGRRLVSLTARHYWYTFIGNVLGYAGMTPAPFSAFEYEDTYPYSGSTVPIWIFGQPDSAGTPGISGTDPQVAATVIRDGNFDYFTNSVRWDRGERQIPDSLYLKGKPAFFGNCQWPWVNPTGSTKVAVLPARARFDGNPNACGEVTAVAPLPPSNFKVDGQ
jgi:hypothetical protein